MVASVDTPSLSNLRHGRAAGQERSSCVPRFTKCSPAQERRRPSPSRAPRGGLTPSGPEFNLPSLPGLKLRRAAAGKNPSKAVAGWHPHDEEPPSQTGKQAKPEPTLVRLLVLRGQLTVAESVESRREEPHVHETIRRWPQLRHGQRRPPPRIRNLR